MGGKKLKTEVEILRSPSILLPIYDFMMDSKQIADKGSFKLWRDKYFGIKLLRGTSVIDIYLRSNDKDLILPALDNIAETYKTYSSKDTRERLYRGRAFIDSQIKAFEEKSLNSQKKFKSLL